MEPMKGKWDSCQVDLGYTELFRIPEVTAVFLSSCEIGVPIDLRRVSQGISGVAQRKPSQLSCMMWNGALL